MRFRLATIAYVFALVAAGMAALGAGGIAAAAIILWILYGPRPIRLTEPLAVLAVLCLTIALLLPQVSGTRPTALRTTCMNNLRQITLGLAGYRDAQGSLPPTVLRSNRGAALHSWRTLVLPFMEYQSLFAKIDLQQPWDSTANAPIVNRPLEVFDCPLRPSRTAGTPYVAIIGDQTVWPAGRARIIEEVVDPPGEAIWALEASQLQVAWAMPVDMTFDEAVAYLTSVNSDHGHHVERGFFYQADRLVHRAFLDGQVRALRLPLPRGMAVALLTVNGGGALSERDLERWSEPQFDYAKCCAIAAFGTLAFGPAALTVWRRVKQPRSYAPPGSCV